MPDNGAFNIIENSNHNVDNDVESNDYQVNLKDNGRIWNTDCRVFTLSQVWNLPTPFVH